MSNPSDKNFAINSSVNNRPKRLYLMRHAHTFDMSATGAVPGADVLLSENGHDQARRIAEYFEGRVKFDALFCTAKERTRQSIECVAEMQGLPVTVIPELSEVPFLFTPDTPVPVVLKTYAALAEGIRTRNFDQVNINEFTTFADFHARLMTGLSKVLAAHGENILLMSHGGTNLLLLCHFLGVGFENLMAFFQHNCAINIIDCHPPEHFIVQTINFTPLDPLKSDVGLKLAIDPLPLQPRRTN